jgi:hypothetical protein
VVAFAAYVIFQEMNTEQLQGIAREQAETDRASEVGMGSVPFKKVTWDRCHSQFTNPETANDCFNAALYGNFGEVFDRYYQRQKLEYVAAVYCGPVLRHPAELIQAANDRSVVTV